MSAPAPDERRDQWTGEEELALPEFRRFGGDLNYLSWLIRKIGEDAGPKQPTPDFDGILKLSRRLRAALEGVSLTDFDVEALRDTLNELDMTTFHTGVLDFTRHGDGGKGPRVKRPGLYLWMGALLPYTAWLSHGQPKWAWLDRWLATQNLGEPNSQVIWNKEIRNAKAVNQFIAKLMLDGAEMYLHFYRKVKTTKTKSPDDGWLSENILVEGDARPWRSEERRYFLSLEKYIPLDPDERKRFLKPTSVDMEEFFVDPKFPEGRTAHAFPKNRRAA
jgi:hypothetical protein